MSIIGSAWLGWSDLTYVAPAGHTGDYEWPLAFDAAPALPTLSETVKALDLLHRITGPGGSPLTTEQDGVLTALGEWLDAQAEELTGDPRTGDDGALTAGQGQVFRNVSDFLEGASDG